MKRPVWISIIIVIGLAFGLWRACQPVAVPFRFAIAEDTTVMASFPDKISAGDSSTATRVEEFVLIEMKPGYDTEYVEKHFSNTQFTLAYTTGDSNARTTTTRYLKWARNQSHNKLAPTLIKGIAKTLGNDNVAWVAPVYRKDGIDGSAGLFAAMPDALFIQADKITVDLEKQFDVMGMQEQIEALVPGFRFYTFNDISRFNAYRVKEWLLKQPEFKDTPGGVFFDHMPFARGAATALNPLPDPDQGFIESLGLEQAWTIVPNPPTPIIVAVIDYGCNVSDFPDVQFTASSKGMYLLEPSNGTPNWRVDQDHGSYVASIIAAGRSNGIGIDGVGNNVQIMSLSLVSERDDEIIRAVRYATDNGAKIINMSLGNSTAEPVGLQTVINYAHTKGVFMCASTGNASINLAIRVPARLNHVMAVGGCNGDNLDPNSCYGDIIVSGRPVGVSVVAPSINITTLDFRGDPRQVSGTSVSCPMVAGIAALLLAKNSTMTPDQLQLKMESTTDQLHPGVTFQLRLGDPTKILRNPQVGYGRVNAGNAVTQ